MSDEQHRQHLLEQLNQRQLALFLGMDLPREITGLPSRAELARELARRYKLDESLPLTEVAQRVSQAGNRWEFTNFTRTALEAGGGKSPQPFHQRIVTLVQEHHIETVITTAYDNLLEMAFQQAGISINRVVRGSDVSFIVHDRPTLIKFYGDAQQPDTLVVTDRDHNDLMRDRDKEPLIDEVRQAFRRKTMLFLGYNLADPDFRFLFDQVAESKFARTAYAVWPGLPEADVRMWRDRGIVILENDPLQILSGERVTLQTDQETIPPTLQLESSEMEWNSSAVRDLLTAAFDHQELTTLCFDHFRPVYEDLSGGMSKRDKVQRLLDYCDRHDEFARLVQLVQKLNPAQYQRYATVLQQTRPSPGRNPARITGT